MTAAANLADKELPNPPEAKEGVVGLIGLVGSETTELAGLGTTELEFEAVGDIRPPPYAKPSPEAEPDGFESG